jgi:hypothetical protein
MIEIPSHITALFEDLGPRTDAIDVIAFDVEAAAWRAVFDDDTELVVEWDAECSRLMVQASLGRPSEVGLLRAYEAALAYNALWRENGNARIARVGNDGELVLMFEVPAAELAVDTLQLALSSVRSVAQVWTRLIANAGNSDEERSSATAPLPLQRV